MEIALEIPSVSQGYNATFFLPFPKPILKRPLSDENKIANLIFCLSTGYGKFLYSKSSDC
jgi:hypothetical protein